MTVKELIEKLQRCEPEAQVHVQVYAAEGKGPQTRLCVASWVHYDDVRDAAGYTRYEHSHTFTQSVDRLLVKSEYVRQQPSAMVVTL